MEDLDSTIEKGILDRPHLWLVWVRTPNSINSIMAICTSASLANRYRKYLKDIDDYEFEWQEQHKYVFIWIEETVANHLISINYQ
jgi:hypothetical protein